MGRFDEAFAYLGQTENHEEIQEMLFVDFIPKQLTAIEAVISEVRYFATEGMNVTLNPLTQMKTLMPAKFYSLLYQRKKNEIQHTT